MWYCHARCSLWLLSLRCAQVARCTKIIKPGTEEAKYVINVKQIAKVHTLSNSYCQHSTLRMYQVAPQTTLIAQATPLIACSLWWAWEIGWRRQTLRRACELGERSSFHGFCTYGP